MEKIIVTQDQIDNMDQIHEGENSTVYESNGNVYKMFSDEYKEMSDENLLRIKLEMADTLTLPGITIPNGILLNEERVLTGVRYPKIAEELKLNCSDLTTYTKRYIDISKTLQKASEQDVVLTDFRAENLRLNQDGTISVIDYDGMQVKEIPTPSRSEQFDNFFMSNLMIGEKYFDIRKKLSTGYNFWTNEVNVFNSIVFYFMDCLGLKINTIQSNIGFYISQLGLREYDINHKIWKLFTPYPNEYFTDDEFNLINEKYKLEPMPGFDGCKRFTRK